jgi:tetratricopeptide (TPR) repeat protein
MDIPESSINEILENAPSKETLHILLPLFKADGKYSLLIRECQKAVLRFPDDLILKKILAEAYLTDGRLLEAEAEAGRVIEGIKKLATVYKLQADIYLRQDKKEAAALCLKRFLLFYPEDKDAALKLEDLALPEEASKPVPEESVMDSGMQELEQELPEIITATLAKVYFDQGKIDEARDIYGKLIDMNPDDAISASRFKEISALSDIDDIQAETRPVNGVRHKKEKIISILDAWRKNIREVSGGVTTV